VFTEDAGDMYFHDNNEALLLGGEVIKYFYGTFIENKGFL